VRHGIVTAVRDVRMGARTALQVGSGDGSFILISGRCSEKTGRRMGSFATGRCLREIGSMSARLD
jgi:hypothetical protein